ncbi:MAG: InlB B-repeat-containing protein [Lachnospiraceae bacterium]|nr:InlB B-repeat-containing protein [Lachnospiraceae bacterium]
MKITRKLLKNNIGLSMIELILTIAIMSLVSVGIGSAVVSATRNYSRNNTEIDLQQEVQNITNILNNLVIDSAEADNIADDDGNIDYGVLNITSIDGIKYKIYLSGNVLTYDKLKSDGSVEESYELSDEVTSFSADASNYGVNHTVHFNVAFLTSFNERDMSSSFTATSRNAETSNTVLQMENSAVIVVDKFAIVEPNQTITIPYDVLVSGNETFSVSYDKSDISANTEINVNTTLNDDNKAITVKAGFDEMHSDIHVTLKVVGSDGHEYDTADIDVKVRRVTGDPSVSAPLTSGTAYSKNAVYTVNTSIPVYNPEKDFAAAMDTDYVSPFHVAYRISGTNIASIPDLLKVTVNGEEKNATSFEALSSDTVEVILKEDMPEKAAFTITATAIHGGYLKADATPGAEGTAYNKTTKKYASDSDFIYENSVTILHNTIFTFDGFRRGSMKNSDYWSEITDTKELYETFVKESLLDAMISSGKLDTAIVNEINNDRMAGLPTGSNTYKSVTDVIRSNCNFAVFYSVGSTEVNSLEAGNKNLNRDGYYWSQYRLLPGANGSMQYRFEEDMSRRFEPDKQYNIETVLVIYTDSGCSMYDGKYEIPAHSILYPGYDKLMELGFADAGYSFADCAVDDRYYVDSVAVGISEIRFKNSADSTILTKTYGSDSTPIQFSQGENRVYNDRGSWIGTGYNEYENVLGGILQIKTDSGWVNYSSVVSGLIEDSTNWPDPFFKSNDKFCTSGNYQIKAENTNYRINYQNLSTNVYSKVKPGAEYRILCQFRDLDYSYIIDSDGIWGDVRVSSGHNYNLYSLNPGNEWGTIYFKTVKDGDIVTYHTIRFDYNDGTGAYKDVSVFDANDRFTPPDLTGYRDGYTFVGWFDSWGNLVSLNNTASQYKGYSTLYAHWTELGDTHTISLNANGGTVSKSSITVYENGNFSELVDPNERSGYLFRGWYTSSTGGTQVTSGTSYSSVKNNLSGTLYALWRDLNSSECKVTKNSSYKGDLWINGVKYTADYISYKMTWTGTDSPSAIVTVSDGSICQYNGTNYTGGQSFVISFDLNQYWTSQDFTLAVVGSVSIK